MQEFLERFDHFKDAELISIDVVNPMELTITLHTQDSARDFDWIAVEILFSGIKDAILPDDKRIKALELSEGISLIAHEDQFAFSLCESSSFDAIKECHSYIISESIKTIEKSL